MMLYPLSHSSTLTTPAAVDSISNTTTTCLTSSVTNSTVTATNAVIFISTNTVTTTSTVGSGLLLQYLSFILSLCPTIQRISVTSLQLLMSSMHRHTSHHKGVPPPK